MYSRHDITRNYDMFGDWIDSIETMIGLIPFWDIGTQNGPFLYWHSIETMHLVPWYLRAYRAAVLYVYTWLIS